MSSKHAKDEAGSDLDPRLKALLAEIRDEPISDEIRALVDQLEAALIQRDRPRPELPGQEAGL